MVIFARKNQHHLSGDELDVNVKAHGQGINLNSKDVFGEELQMVKAAYME